MSSRRNPIRDRNHLANVLTKLEDSKHPATVGAIRRSLKRLVELEAALIMSGCISAVMKLRREAKALAKKKKAKKK